MKKIYIIVSQTGTMLSRLIKMVTGKQYTHAAIALDGRLNKMYSFGRKTPYNPFVGVFVIENINQGTLRRFRKTTASILSLEVSEEQYEKMKEVITDIQRNRKQYKYNVLGLLLAGFNKPRQVKNKFYCSEFVKYILEESNVDTSSLPQVVHPIHFLNLRYVQIEYEGVLRRYVRQKKEKQIQKQIEKERIVI